jgi:hypothetical protein
MRRRAARGNRVGLALLGLPTLLAGGVVLARSAGGSVIYPPAAQRYVHGHGWIWPAVAAVAIVVGLVCLRWLLVQARRDRLLHIRIDSDRRPAAEEAAEEGAGRTIVPAEAISDFVTSELADQPGVRRVRAELSGRPDRSELWLRVTVAADTDLARLRGHLTDELLPDLRGALDQPELSAYVRVHVTRGTGQDRPGVLIGESARAEPGGVERLADHPRPAGGSGGVPVGDARQP